MSFLKGTKFYSIITGTCPVCQEESMYKESNPYKINMIFEMHERCSNCGTKYKLEPSFFFGAMYVSYALGVAVSVGAFIIAYFFFWRRIGDLIHNNYNYIDHFNASAHKDFPKYLDQYVS